MSNVASKWRFVRISGEKAEEECLRKHMDTENTILIRPEKTRDYEDVFIVNASAFPSDAEARIVNGLRNAGLITLSLVAEANRRIIGNIVFSEMSIEENEENLKAVGLAPLCVHPEFQKQGVGNALVRFGIDICREMGYDIIAVLGSDYYSRFGFISAKSANVLSMDKDIPAEHFQCLRFDNKFQMKTLRLKYAPQFFM